MPKRIITAVTAAVMLLGLLTARADAYTPSNGVMFNNPLGTAAQQNQSMVHVRRTINSVPTNGIIRIALYSNDRQDIADALITACRKRHVSVQIVLNNNFVSRASIRLKRLMGSGIKPKYGDACHPVRKPAHPDRPNARKPYPIPSFVRICDGACRLGGTLSNQHMKFLLFSKAGRAKPVVMFGSTNLTGFAAHVHWNDLFTVTGRQQMFDDYSHIFAQMAADKRVRHPYVVYQNGDLTTEFGSDPGATGKKDHVWKRLNQVSCKAPRGYGINGHSTIRIMMYGWVGDRGLFLAKKVASLARSGCRVWVLISGASARVRSTLTRAGVQLRSAAIDVDDDPETGFEDTGWEVFSHEKWMSLDGRYAGKPFSGVWTGSENWSGISRHNDELTVKIPRSRIHDVYVSHFNLVWSQYTRGVYPPPERRFARSAGLSPSSPQILGDEPAPRVFMQYAE